MAKHLQAKILIQPRLKGNLAKAACIQLILTISFFLFSNNVIGQTTIESVNDGSWNSTSTWEGAIPAADDNVIINDIVTIQTGTTAEAKELHISKSGKLIIEGTLIIHGNLTMENNGSELQTGTAATVIIFGDAILDNQVVIDLSSYFIVQGSFLRNGADNQGSISIEDAHIYVFGEISSSWNDFTACEPGDYEGTTASETDDCDAGQLDDFIEIVDADDLPDGIYEEIVGCEEPAITNHPSTSDAQYCEGELANSLSVTATGEALTFQWYMDDDNTPEEGDETPVDSDSQSYTPSTATPGTSYYYCVISNDCGTETSNVSGAITILPLPDTGEIIPD